jgi:HEAT repeat protein
LRDKDARVRAQAAAALAETGPLAQPAVENLISIVQTGRDDWARLQATRALASMGPEARAAVPALVERLRQEKDFGIRVNTVFALGQIHAAPEVTVPVLIEAYLAWGGNLAALRPFGPAAARFGIPVLQQALKDPAKQQDKALQERAARALEMLERERRQARTSAAPKSSAKP